MRVCSALAVVLVSARCAFPAEPDPLVDGLRRLPVVKSVDVVRIGDGKPVRRIVLLLDWHYVARKDFYADLRDQSPDIADEELAAEYDKHLAQVGKVQSELMDIMRHLSKAAGVKAVHVGGLTAKNRAAHLKFIATLAEFEANKPKGKTPFEQFLLLQFEEDRLSLGAAGRLAMSGGITVLPLDDDAAYRAANPVQPDGSVVFDQKAIERRENAMVGFLLASPHKPTVAILGNAHDLADNVKRVTSETVEVIRIRSKRVARLTKRGGRDRE